MELEGVDVIQTEGGKCSNPTKSGIMGLIEKVTGKILLLYFCLFPISCIFIAGDLRMLYNVSGNKKMSETLYKILTRWLSTSLTFTT